MKFINLIFYFLEDLIKLFNNFYKHDEYTEYDFILKIIFLFFNIYFAN